MLSRQFADGCSRVIAPRVCRSGHVSSLIIGYRHSRITTDTPTPTNTDWIRQLASPPTRPPRRLLPGVFAGVLAKLRGQILTWSSSSTKISRYPTNLLQINNLQNKGTGGTAPLKRAKRVHVLSWAFTNLGTFGTYGTSLHQSKKKSRAQAGSFERTSEQSERFLAPVR